MYETAMYYPFIQNIFTFTKSDPNITLQTSPLTGTDASFSIANATYVSGTTTILHPQVGITTLSDDYLAYVSKKTWGVTNLISNTEEILSSITNTSVYESIDNANTQDMTPTTIAQYDIAPDTTALFTIYTTVLENEPSRMTDAPQDQMTSLLQEGDTLELQVILHSNTTGPPIDDITYLLRVHLIHQPIFKTLRFGFSHYASASITMDITRVDTFSSNTSLPDWITSATVYYSGTFGTLSAPITGLYINPKNLPVDFTDWYPSRPWQDVNIINQFDISILTANDGNGNSMTTSFMDGPAGFQEYFLINSQSDPVLYYSDVEVNVTLTDGTGHQYG